MKHVLRQIWIGFTAALLVGFVGACGSSKPKPASTATAATTQAATTQSASANPVTATASTATTGTLRATLTGTNHTPVVNRNWSYTVRATDPSGKPLSGTVETEFVFPGLGVVGKEAPPTHPLKDGVLTDTLQFPAAALGHPLRLVTVVHTSAGSVALAWPVTIAK